MSLFYIIFALITLQDKALAIYTPMLVYKIVSWGIHCFMRAFLHIATELLITVMCIDMHLLLSVSKLFAAQVDFASKLNLGQWSSQVVWQLCRAEWLLAVRTGTFTVRAAPVRHAILAEHSLAVSTLFRYANDLCAHHTREMFINLVHYLLLLELGDAVGEVYALISRLQVWFFFRYEFL